MRTSLNTLWLGALAAATLSGAAQAAVQQQTSSTASLAPATLTCNNQNPCPVTSTATGTLTFNQFNADNGVLTGATFLTSMSGSPVVNYDSNKTGSASYAETAVLAGTTRSSTATDSNGNAGVSVSANAYGASATSVTDLNALVGASNVSATVNGTLTNAKTGTGGSATASVTSHQTSGVLTYDYVGHSNASFAGTDTNSAALSAGSSFSIFNLLGGNSSAANLAFSAIRCTGSCTAFNLGFDADSFAAVAGGGVNLFTTALKATAAGNYAAHYTLEFIDSFAGAASSTLRTNTLSLDLTGNVAAVPEPESAALFMAGLLALGTLRRRRLGER